MATIVEEEGMEVMIRNVFTTKPPHSGGFVLDKEGELISVLRRTQ